MHKWSNMNQMGMKTPIHLNNKGNEIIAWCLFNIWSCLFMSSHHHYMCCHYQCSLHHICASWVNNDDIHWGLKVVSSDKDIHLTLGVMKEKVGNLSLNIVPFSKAIATIVFRNVSWVVVGSPPQGHKANGYLNFQSHDHIDIVTNGQP